MDVEISTSRFIISSVVTASRQVGHSGDVGIGIRGELGVRPWLAVIDHTFSLPLFQPCVGSFALYKYGQDRCGTTLLGTQKPPLVVDVR